MSSLTGGILGTRWAESSLTVLCPTVCSVAIGLIAHGVHVFTPQSGFFQLGVNGVIVGVLVLLARRWSAERFLAAGVVVTVAMAAMAMRSGPRIVLHTVVLMVMWIGVVSLNVKVLSRRRWGAVVGQYVAWSAVYAAGLFGAGMVLIIFFRPAETMPYVASYGKLAVLTGIGLGIGFKVQDWLSSSSQCEPG